MSDSEEETCFFGTPLEPYDEDAFPKKRPITVEEQVAKDAQGRRRFHGAFTGGFSAGFYNTVGSLEGWAPKEFKSSRSEKAQSNLQKPEDFMDDEDVGEFGIAPQTVRTTAEYSVTKKRKRLQAFPDGPIPGEPVLETLIQAGNESVGYFLMKNMNRNYTIAEDAEKSRPRVYGCVMPKELPTDDTLEDLNYNLPDVYKQYLSAPKSNTFGLGYVGLDKSHLNLFQPSKLKVHGKNNKKLSISGQAFGVGAFEDDDEDIYVKDDMSRYDFELTAEATNKNKKVSKAEGLVLDIFVLSKNTLVSKNDFPPPIIPSSFTGKHNIRKSRFEPIAEETETPNRSAIDVSIRAKYLGENHSKKNYTPSNQQHKQKHTTPARDNNKKLSNNDVPVIKTEKVDEPTSSSSGLLFDRFVTAQQEDDPTNLLEKVKPTEMSHGTKEMHAAVKLKMFGPLTRVTIEWQPCSLLCKRFNVPEPNFDKSDMQKNKKRTKNLIFEYQKHSEDDLPQKPGLSLQANKSDESQIALETNSTVVLENDTQEASTSNAEVKLELSTEEAPEKDSNEKILDITERVDVSKNTDLFKAVFLSSSESESENEVAEDEEEKRKELITANVLSEPLVPKIKPTKEGILSNIDFTKFQSTRNGSNEEQQTAMVDNESTSANLALDCNTYGPRLPARVSSANPVLISEPAINSHEWVEKDFVAKEKKHKKKHKKQKDKHKKKHKHKSKK